MARCKPASTADPVFAAVTLISSVMSAKRMASNPFAAGDDAVIKFYI